MQHPADGEDCSTPLSLYVHVPFCLSKCAYCDFHSEPDREDLFGAYVDAVLFQVGHWSHYDLLDDVSTLYVGGGTPTLLGGELVRLLDGLHETVTLTEGAEVTVEANPESVSAGLLRELAAAGLTRVSLGAQSFDDGVLARLGRCHDAATARRAADDARTLGLELSVDLMCGAEREGAQGAASWRRSVELALATGADHMSVYPLQIEEGTPLASAVGRGEAAMPDADVLAERMEYADERLAEAGLVRYEVANHARPGHESRHNLGYWTGRPYLGAGAAAHSMLPALLWERLAQGEGWEAIAGRGDVARVRFAAPRNTPWFVRRPLAAPTDLEYLPARVAAVEDVMLGLRLARGVPAAQVASAGLEDVLASLAADGLTELAEGRWRTTRSGWLLGNEVFGRVWAAAEADVGENG